MHGEGAFHGEDALLNAFQFDEPLPRMRGKDEVMKGGRQGSKQGRKEGRKRKE
jgi:hypothetical protein